jgi:putative spermidine/putrescine transport system permease protein
MRKKFKEVNQLGFLVKFGSFIALCVLLTPVIIVVLTGLNSGDHLTFPPEGLSTRWIVAFFQSEEFLNAFLFSFGLALIVMVISTFIGTMAAIFITRFNFPGVNLLRALFLSPLILPGIVLGLALYIFYVSTDIGLARSYPGMVIAHVLVTLPYVIGTVSASLFNFDLNLEQAARSLGASPLTAFRKVTLPNISNGVMAGSVFAFIVSFGQFDVSLFMSTPNNTPLPIALYWSLRYTFEPTAAAAGIFAIVLVVISMLITSKLVDLKKFSGVKFD